MTVWIEIPTQKKIRVPLEQITFVDNKSSEPREGQSYGITRKFTRASTLRDDRDPSVPEEERDYTIVMETDVDQTVALVATDFRLDEVPTDESEPSPSPEPEQQLDTAP